MENCNLCREISGTCAISEAADYRQLVADGKNILLESPNLVAIPSIGPLNNTHVMIVPRRHVNCIAALSQTELNEAMKMVKSLSSHILKKTGNKLVFFESGASERYSHSGGCIAHAHIHCVAGSADFSARIFREIDLIPTSPWDYSTADKKNGYVSFIEEDGTFHLCNNPLLPSQFLRYIYADQTGTLRGWNWRKHPNIEGVLRVIETYRGIETDQSEQAR